MMRIAGFRRGTASVVGRSLWLVAAAASCSPSSKPSPLSGQGPTCTFCDAATLPPVPACGRCSNSAECATPLLCNVDGHCALECSSSNPCPLGLPCKEGLCSCGAGSADAATEAAQSDAASGDVDAPSEAFDAPSGALAPAGLVQVSTSSNSTVVTARFSAAGGPCLPSTLGGCLVYTCFGDPPPGPAPGDITVRGGSAPDGGIVLVFDPDAGGYDPYTAVGKDEFPAGSVVAISASTGALPAFMASVTAATDVSIGALPTVIDRTMDTTITWAHGTAPATVTGEVVISLSTQSPNITVECSAPVSDDRLTLPATALQALPPGHQAVLQASVRSDSTAMAGTTPVTARQISTARSSAGDLPPVAVTLTN